MKAKNTFPIRDFFVRLGAFATSAINVLCIISALLMTEASAANQTTDAVRDWHSFMRASAKLDTAHKIKRVNDFFNRLTHVLDRTEWGVEDYWATPREFLSRRAGDCEDFALAKYYTLRKLGVPVDKLRLVYVNLSEVSAAHMVLAYYPNPHADPLVLDNFTEEIVTLSRRSDLVAMFSFNHKALWRDASKPQTVSANRLKRWREFRARVGREKG